MIASRQQVKERRVTLKSEYRKMSEDYLKEVLRLKNKIYALQNEILESDKNHKRDIGFYQSKLKDMEIQKDEEETYISCKNFEEIEKLERELIHKTEKIKLTKCVFLVIGMVAGYILAQVV